jgi:phytoene synthase
MATQLTNICRDVAEDWQRGRLYLPRDVLGDASHARLCRALGGDLPDDAAPALAGAVRALLALADRYYASGDRGLAHLEWRAAMAVRTARLVYAEIGGELRRRGHDVRAGRAVVPRRRKLRLALRALGRAAAERQRVQVAVPEAHLAAAEALAPLPGGG